RDRAVPPAREAPAELLAGARLVVTDGHGCRAGAIAAGFAVAERTTAQTEVGLGARLVDRPGHRHLVLVEGLVVDGRRVPEDVDEVTLVCGCVDESAVLERPDRVVDAAVAAERQLEHAAFAADAGTRRADLVAVEDEAGLVGRMVAGPADVGTFARPQEQVVAGGDE